jgi:hypothetical protein
MEMIMIEQTESLLPRDLAGWKTWWRCRIDDCRFEPMSASDRDVLAAFLKEQAVLILFGEETEEPEPAPPEYEYQDDSVPWWQR